MITKNYSGDDVILVEVEVALEDCAMVATDIAVDVAVASVVVLGPTNSSVNSNSNNNNNNGQQYDLPAVGDIHDKGNARETQNGKPMSGMSVRRGPSRPRGKTPRASNGSGERVSRAVRFSWANQ